MAASQKAIILTGRISLYGSAALVDEARRLDVRLELARDRAALEQGHSRRYLESSFNDLDHALLGLRPHFDVEVKHIIAAFIKQLRAEVDHLGIAKQRVFQVGMVDVHAAHLEETDGAARMPHDRIHRPGAIACALRAEADEVARTPAQERRHAVAPQWRDDERADLPVGDRLAALVVDHLEAVHIGESMQAMVADGLARDERAFGHAEVVEHLDAPGALQLLALHRGQRFGRDDDLFYGAVF